MDIGITVGLQLGGPQTLDDVVAEVRHVADLGFTTAWWSQAFGWDALTSIAVTGRAVPDIGLGTAVVPTYPRHPVALAAQALTAQAATGGRLTLGIGPSHAPIIEGAFGLRFDRPAAHTREYLEVLGPLLRGETVEHHGEQLRVAAGLTLPEIPAPTVLVSALGPTMLRIAGELTDGTIATWTGVRTLSDHIVPRLTAAASAAGRPSPRVLVSVPVAVTDDPDGARGWAEERFGAASGLPSYRAMLDIEGVDSAADLVIAGDEGTVEHELRRLVDAGATELIPVPIGEPGQVERTLAALASLASPRAIAAPA